MMPRTARSHFALVAVLTVICLALAVFPAEPEASTCIEPPTTGKSWPRNTSVRVYVDPSLPSPAAVRDAVSMFFDQYAVTSSGISYQFVTYDTDGLADSIRIVNDPSGSPNNLAAAKQWYWSQSPSHVVRGTIWFNPGFMLGPNVPAHDPSAPGASDFITKVALHELGHLFGLAHTPIPNDPQGQPNACLQPDGTSVMNGFCNTNDSGNNMPLSPTPCDGAAVTSAISSADASTGGSGGTEGGGEIDGDVDDKYDPWAGYCPPCDWNDEEATLYCWCY